MTTTVRLEAPGLTPLPIETSAGYFLRRLDLGWPDVRVVMQDAADADGAIDTTQYLGARVVGMQCRIFDSDTFSIETALNRLKAFGSPRLRPTLFITGDDLIARRMTLRAGPFSAPYEQATHVDVTMQWIASTGIIESDALNMVPIFAGGAGVELGRGYNLTFDRAYPTSPVLGEATVTNAGTTVAYPIIRIYGPCTNPVVTNVTQGRTLSFTGLTILVGEFVEINTRTKTIRYNALSTDSRYSTLVFPTSSWLALLPGVNILRFTPATSTPPAQAQIEWRDSWL